MRFSGSAFMGLCFALMSLWAVITALKWPLRSALFPVVVGSLVCLMATIKFLFALFKKGKGNEDSSGFDFKLSEYTDQTSATRRTVSIFLWILGFFFLVLLIGFPVAVPLFFILFLKLQGKEGWGMSIGLAAAAWLGFYALFVRVLNLPFLEGWVQRGLRTLGIV